MPIYAYHCAQCDATYELQQSFSAETAHTCEECGKGTARRVLYAPRIVFKGSGWYATDSRKSSTAVSDAPAGESETTTETKPASLPDEGAAAAAAG